MSSPPALKAVSHYLKIANEHMARDPVIYYWCTVYAVQSGMTIDKKSPECVRFLSNLLAQLEDFKRKNAGNDAITIDIVGQAHVENMALKMFIWADNQDRNAIFNKNVVKAFYTAGHLMDVLSLFGELEEKIAENRKYAKWKAAYIHNCLQMGETPVPGPANDNNDESDAHTINTAADILKFEATKSTKDASDASDHNNHLTNALASLDVQTTNVNPNDRYSDDARKTDSSAGITSAEFSLAFKYCKYAANAIQYEDLPAAIENLETTLRILRTGKE